MAEGHEVIRSRWIAVPHGFLDAPQSDARHFDLVAPGAELVLLRQVHSARAVAVDQPWPADVRPEADAMATNRPGLALAIVTADCAPLLLADAGAGVIGAAHAGWRGALGGVIEATVLEMEKLGARRAHIAAAIGPAIAQPSYEVDQEFHDRLVEHDAANVDLLQPGAPGHYQFDLPAYVARRLRSAEVGTVEELALDTYADSARFHSYRRAIHRGGGTEGRQFSLISLPG